MNYQLKSNESFKFVGDNVDVSMGVRDMRSELCHMLSILAEFSLHITLILPFHIHSALLTTTAFFRKSLMCHLLDLILLF